MESQARSESCDVAHSVPAMPRRPRRMLPSAVIGSVMLIETRCARRSAEGGGYAQVRRFTERCACLCYAGAPRPTKPLACRGGEQRALRLEVGCRMARVLQRKPCAAIWRAYVGNIWRCLTPFCETMFGRAAVGEKCVAQCRTFKMQCCRRVNVARG